MGELCQHNFRFSTRYATWTWRVLLTYRAPFRAWSNWLQKFNLVTDKGDINPKRPASRALVFFSLPIFVSDLLMLTLSAAHRGRVALWKGWCASSPFPFDVKPCA